jgi:hypothetical protein
MPKENVPESSVAPSLTATSVRYLFASRWAERQDSLGGVRVPGGKVAGIDTAANLLDLAVWSLREQGLVDVQKLRPVESQRILTQGGRLFTRLRVLDERAELPGLEGSLLDAARKRRRAGSLRRVDDALGNILSRDDEDGLRRHVLAMNLNQGTPWTDVINRCRDEARDAGMIQLERRRFARTPVIQVDAEELEALEARDAEIAAARSAYKEREAELDEAVLADCTAAILWSHRD